MLLSRLRRRPRPTMRRPVPPQPGERRDPAPVLVPPAPTQFRFEPLAAIPRPVRVGRGE